LIYLDKPKFGEIVHEPPILTLPKKSKANQLAVISFLSTNLNTLFLFLKAGTKDLLLKEKINQWNRK